MRIDDAAPAIIFLATDADGRITAAEGRALGRLGQNGGRLLGRSILDVDGDLAALRDHARRALGGESFDVREELGGVTFDCTWHALPGGTTVGRAGSRYGQGYHLAWPSPASEVTSRLAASGRPADAPVWRGRDDPCDSGEPQRVG